MIFDDHSFRATAAAIRKHNPAAARAFPTNASAISYMKAMAERELSNCYSYYGTLGFYITTYANPRGDIAAIATLSPTLVVTDQEMAAP